MAVLPHYVWLTFGSSLYNQVASTNTNGQLETFGGIITNEDGLALAAGPAAETRNRGNKRSVSMVVDNGASGHSFDDSEIARLRYKLEHYQVPAIRRWITTVRGHQLKETGQGLLRGHSIGTQGFKRLTQLSVSAGPDVERDLFSFKQDGAPPGGDSLAGTPEGRKPRDQPVSLGEASLAGEFCKVARL